jgi:hypothetical protein
MAHTEIIPVIDLGPTWQATLARSTAQLRNLTSLWRRGRSRLHRCLWSSGYQPSRLAHCRSAASATPIKAAAASQFPSRCEAEALR